MFRLLFALPVLFGLVLGQNLLTNGNFEQELSVGWSPVMSGLGSHSAERAVWRHPDPDYECWVQQYDGSGSTRLEQTVNVPHVNLDFSFAAQFAIGGGSSTCWPVASVILEYLNASGAMLGETRFYYHNAYCNWVPTSTVSLIDIGSPDWMSYNLNVAEEIRDNLPGMNASQVRKIRVAFYDYTSGG